MQLSQHFVHCFFCFLLILQPKLLVSQWGGLGRRWGGDTYEHSKIHNNKWWILSIIHCLVATSLTMTWHLDSVWEMWVGRGELLTLASHRLCLFVGAGVICVHFGAFIVIWAGIFFICGWLWVVVGSLASFQWPSTHATYMIWALACLLFWVNHGMWEACSMSAKGERTSMLWVHSPIQQCP